MSPPSYRKITLRMTTMPRETPASLVGDSHQCGDDRGEQRSAKKRFEARDLRVQ